MRMTFDRKLFFSTYVQLVVLSTLIFGALLLILAFVLSPIGLVENLLLPGGVIAAVFLGSGYLLLLKKYDNYARSIGAVILSTSFIALINNLQQDSYLPPSLTLYPVSTLFFLTNGLCLLIGSQSTAGYWLWRVSSVFWLLASVLLLISHWIYPVGFLLGNNASATTLSAAFMLLCSPCLYFIPEFNKKGMHSLSKSALCYALTTITLTCLTWYILNLQYYHSVRQTSENLIVNLQQGIDQIVKDHRLLISWLGREWESTPLEPTQDKNNSLKGVAGMILGDMPSLKVIALLPRDNSTPTILAERDTDNNHWIDRINSAPKSEDEFTQKDISMIIDPVTTDAWLIIQVSLSGTDDRVIAVSKFKELLNHHLHLDTKPFSIHIMYDNQEVYHLGGGSHDHVHSELISTSSTTISDGPVLVFNSIHSDKVTEAFFPNFLILLVIFGMLLSVIIATSIELSRFNYSRAESIKINAARQLKIHKIQEMIVNHESLPKTLSKICELLDTSIVDVHSSLWLVDEKSSTLQYIASSRLNLMLKKVLARCAIPLDSVMNDISKSRGHGTLTVNSCLISHDNIDDAIVAEAGYEFWLAIFIETVNGRTLGAIELYRSLSLSHTNQTEIDQKSLTYIGEISPLVSMAIERHQDRENLLYSSQHDALTGLPNRTVLENRLNIWFNKNSPEPSNACLLFIDLDGFKPINDGLGHATGDRVLVEVSKRLSDNFRVGDLVVRFGGDEFVILILDNEDPAINSQLVQRVLNSISEPYLIADLEISVTASIGIAKADAPSEIESPMILIQQADIAMYDAKRRGKNSAQWYDESYRKNIRSQVTLRNELQKALTNNEFELHYQPIISSNGDIQCFESLIRWNHPEYGRIPPDEFIPLAEETGQIIPLSEWVMERACRDAAKLRFNNEVSLSVNIAPLHFHRTDFITSILETLEKYHLKPNAIILELTERTLMDEHGTMIQTLKALRASGLRISIDDFGTGYSSLSFIKHLPVSSIKIDKSFVADIDYSELDAGMARAIIDMAHHLGLDVVAEGVETPEQLSKLRDWGCDSFQGYYLCRPAAVDSISAFVDTWEGFTGAIQ